MSDFVESSFLEDISIQQWEVNKPNGTNPKFDDFLWRVEKCVDRHAPIKKLTKKQLKKRSKPWINNRT